jgi:GNAT superfamily N-acetyltransferase
MVSASRSAVEGEARRVCREPAPDHAALLAVLAGRVVGCGSYEVAGDGSRSAEVALAVSDDMHRRGVGTLLLEHLVSLARVRGVRAFVAETLAENALMMQVFADAGLRARRALADGVYEVSFPLPAGKGDAGPGTYREAVAERERSATCWVTLGGMIAGVPVARSVRPTRCRAGITPESGRSPS